MKSSLRKTPSHLHLAYKYGEDSDSLIGRNFMLGVEGHVVTLEIDLTPNFHTRNKSGSPYQDALNLAHNHHKLKVVRCSDNLVRSRLIRSWERIEQPQMRVSLDLGAHGRFLYRVIPHSLFTGGVQLDVQEMLESTRARAPGESAEQDEESHA
jgi:hypothetical protein